ncbi:hypothetical protein C8J56DRAFT_883586 [Mycena floridula]|nr:hypothetical protein C8J56DRAFT_883586 [Mycena floridula]
MTSPSHRRRCEQRPPAAVNIPILHLPEVPDPPLPPPPGPGPAPGYHYQHIQFPFQFQPPPGPGILAQPAFQYFYPYVIPANVQNPTQLMGYWDPNIVLGQPMEHPAALNRQQIQRRIRSSDQREAQREQQRTAAATQWQAELERRQAQEESHVTARQARQQREVERQREQEQRRIARETRARTAQVGVEVDKSVTRASGPYCFCIHGELTHRIAPLLPRNGTTASYAQLYIHDPAEANRIRTNRNTMIPPIRSAIFAELQNTLHATHPYIPLFKQAFQLMREKPLHEQKEVQDLERRPLEMIVTSYSGSMMVVCGI